MGIPFFILFVLSIAFLSLGVTGWGDFVVVQWDEQNTTDPKNGSIAVTPYLSFERNYTAIGQCLGGFLLFLVSLYFMGFFLYLEERESGRIMKNIKSFAKLRQFLERRQNRTSS